MNVLKHAFEEGRDTKVSWENSESLKKAHLLELQFNNISSAVTHKGKRRKIAQLNPKTGKVINVFSSLFKAAKYINQSRTGHNTKTAAYQAFSNIRVMMVSGSHAYGYYWMFLDPESEIPVTWDIPKQLPKRRPRNLVVVDDASGKVMKFDTEVDAAPIIGQTAESIRRLVRDFGKFSRNGKTIYSAHAYKKIPTPVVVRNEKGHFQNRFPSFTAVAEHLGVKVIDIVVASQNGRAIKGYKFFPQSKF